MTLHELLAGFDFTITIQIDGSQLVTGVTMDSRTVKPGMIFVGNDFIAEARSRGAVCVVSESDLGDILVKNSRQTAAYLCEKFRGYPSRSMVVCGITGTNGKTTVSHILAYILQQAGHQAGIFGTLGYGDSKTLIPTGFTTPECEQLSLVLQTMKNQGFSHVCMEVSSHALASFRADGVHFSAAGFTNLSQDHLDFHHDMASYSAAKDRLFLELLDGNPAVLPVGHHLAMKLPNVISWGFSKAAAVSANKIGIGLRGMDFVLNLEGADFFITSHLAGLHNVENLLCAAAIARGLKVNCELIADALCSASAVPGRMEKISVPEVDGPAVYVDFAHTPDALDRVLATVRTITQGKVLVVFGCGGDRDSGKRPQMGEIAATKADQVFLTDDNPRFEKSADIIGQIENGIKALGAANYQIIPERAEAIRAAIYAAGRNDSVLIAGKGCETTQEIAGQFFSFLDADVACDVLRKI